MTYELCKHFGCLPSDLDKEDAKTMNELLTVMSAMREHEKKGARKENRRKLADKAGGGSVRR